MFLPFHNDLHSALLCQLQQIDFTDPVNGNLKAIDICHEKLQELYHWVKNHTFPDVAAEIDFFKNVKPLFFSQLIYYQEIYRYHLNIPLCGEEARAAYMNTLLTRINHFYADQHEFYAYYRGRYTNCDDSYFTRSHYNPHIAGHLHHTEYQTNFCTNYDEKLAQLLAYEQVIEFLQQPAHTANQQKSNPDDSLPWTLSKMALIELIYGLYVQGAFKNGQAGIREIASYIGKVFSIDPGDYYHKYMEMRMRKTGRTKFLDQLRDGLNKRMEQQDDPW